MFLWRECSLICTRINDEFERDKCMYAREHCICRALRVCTHNTQNAQQIRRRACCACLCGQTVDISVCLKHYRVLCTCVCICVCACVCVCVCCALYTCACHLRCRHSTCTTRCCNTSIKSASTSNLKGVTSSSFNSE